MDVVLIGSSSKLFFCSGVSLWAKWFELSACRLILWRNNAQVEEMDCFISFSLLNHCCSCEFQKRVLHWTVAISRRKGFKSLDIRFRYFVWPLSGDKILKVAKLQFKFWEEKEMYAFDVYLTSNSNLLRETISKYCIYFWCLFLFWASLRPPNEVSLGTETNRRKQFLPLRASNQDKM